MKIVRKVTNLSEESNRGGGDVKPETTPIHVRAGLARVRAALLQMLANSPKRGHSFSAIAESECPQ
jgi:hypothetical protein